jgi:hypothetical protein
LLQGGPLPVGWIEAMSGAMETATISHQSAPDRAFALVYAPRKFNRRSRQRFCANRRAELLRHLGHRASYPEKLIIERICSIEFWLRGLDARLDRGDELSGHAIRGRLAAENRLRLDLRELGLKGAAERAPTLAEAMAAARSAREATAV